MPVNIIYITRDIERALGTKPGAAGWGNYFIITNTGPYAEEIRKKYPENVFLIDRPKGAEPLDTYELLASKETSDLLGAAEATATPAILVFKNTPRVETYCAEKSWKLLNPPAALAEKIENKITQVEWLGDAAAYLPEHEIIKVSEISSGKIAKSGKPFVIQWAHGHTGEGTILVAAGKKGWKIVSELAEKFPDRLARVTEYIDGPMMTINICITSREALLGNISYQITGTLPFTDKPFATVGNDWSLPHSILSEANIAEFNDIARAVGKKMVESGWHGLFGIDCIYDENRNEIRLIEVNARQPASTTYESELQEKIRASGVSGATIFEAHVGSLIGANISGTDMANTANTKNIIEINDGAQIIDRIKTLKIPKIADDSKTMEATETAAIAEKLRAKNYTVIEYENAKPGSDLLRIQSPRGIMEAHNKFNSRGKEIVENILNVL